MPESILYYPTIEFRDPAWVKAALLVWDHVYRIVPAGHRPRDATMIREAVLVDRIRNIVLEEEDVRKTGDGFLEFCDSLPFVPSGMIGDDEDRIDPDKIDQRLYPSLDRIATEFEKDGWLALSSGVARGYMFFLSKNVADRRLLARGTDNRDSWSVDPFFSENANFTEYVYDPDAAGYHSALLVKDLIPANVADLRMKDILRFVRERNDERVQLREELSLAIDLIGGCESEEHRDQIVADELLRFRTAKKAYRDSSGFWQAGFPSAFFAVGVPTTLTAMGVFSSGGDPFQFHSIGPSLTIGAIAAYADWARHPRAALGSASFLVDLDRRLADNKRAPAFHRLFEEFVND